MYTQLTGAGIGVDTLVTILCQEKYNTHGQEMNFLGPVLSNLSQLPEVRKHILDRGRCVIQRLVAFTEYSNSAQWESFGVYPTKSLNSFFLGKNTSEISKNLFYRIINRKKIPF